MMYTFSIFANSAHMQTPGQTLLLIQADSASMGVGGYPLTAQLRNPAQIFETRYSNRSPAAPKLTRNPLVAEWRVEPSRPQIMHQRQHVFQLPPLPSPINHHRTRQEMSNTLISQPFPTLPPNHCSISNPHPRQHQRKRRQRLVKPLPLKKQYCKSVADLSHAFEEDERGDLARARCW